MKLSYVHVISWGSEGTKCKKEREKQIRNIVMVFDCCGKTDRMLKQGIDKEEGGLILALAVGVGRRQVVRTLPTTIG